MKLFILSGHFSLPEERDPWTGSRYNFNQEEAFQNKWKLLLKDCYGANSASRILTHTGLIHKIVNNFCHLSFSFSPSLLDELKKDAPNVYRKICEGDRDSLERLGHGNALAQPYHHVILPLTSEKDRKLQLLWGMQAFENHFHRKPEGFYLPEYAVSTPVLDDLVELGIRFILLSCNQVEGTMPIGLGSWTRLDVPDLLSCRPLRIDRPRGSLTVFFHHPTLSHNLPEYLRDADHLCHVITTMMRDESSGPILSFSAQGEMFGHTEPFADMCLAALWDKFPSEEIQVANYGLANKLYPPQELVKLKKGENEAGTSSSCHHGLRRWKEGCSCAQTAAMASQTWKIGLRTCFTKLKDSCELFLEETLRKWEISLEDFQQDVLPLISSHQHSEEWFENYKQKHGLTEQEKGLLLEMALIVLHSQAMMESCLWHYDSPLLTAARGGILQALFVLDLVAERAVEDWEFTFFQDLENIKIYSEQSLADAIRKAFFSQRRSIHFPAALFLLDRLFRSSSSLEKQIGHFHLIKFEKKSSHILDRFECFQGYFVLYDERLDREFLLDYLLVEDNKEGVSLFFKPQGDQQAPQSFDLSSLPMDERQDVVQLISNRLETLLSDKMETLFPFLRKSIIYSHHLKTLPLLLTKTLIELASTRKLLALSRNSELALVESELSFAYQYELNLDKQRLERHFSRWLAQEMRDDNQFLQEGTVSYIERLLQIVNQWGYRIDTTIAQLLVYEAITKFIQKDDKQEKDLSLMNKGNCLVRLAQLFQIEIDTLKNRLKSFDRPR